jgi:hypothetical protein
MQRIFHTLIKNFNQKNLLNIYFNFDIVVLDDR